MFLLFTTAKILNHFLTYYNIQFFHNPRKQDQFLINIDNQNIKISVTKYDTNVAQQTNYCIEP